jgi:hypothetical protein
MDNTNPPRPPAVDRRRVEPFQTVRVGPSETVRITHPIMPGKMPFGLSRGAV